MINLCIQIVHYGGAFKIFIVHLVKPFMWRIVIMKTLFML